MVWSGMQQTIVSEMTDDWRRLFCSSDNILTLFTLNN